MSRCVTKGEEEVRDRVIEESVIFVENSSLTIEPGLVYIVSNITLVNNAKIIIESEGELKANIVLKDGSSFVIKVGGSFIGYIGLAPLFQKIDVTHSEEELLYFASDFASSLTGESSATEF